MPKAEFGIRLPVGGPLASLENIKLVARKTEEMGYDTVWASDHIMWTKRMIYHIGTGSLEAVRDEQDPDVYESLTTLSYLAALTKEIKLGIAVIVPPPRHPVVLAKQIANLDILSEGRLILAVGVGSKGTSAEPFAAYHLPFERRGKIAREYIEAMREIWTKNIVSYNGEFVKFTNVEIFPKPLQKPYPPILTGGFSDVAIRRAATIGDGWLPGFLTPEQVRTGLDEIKQIRKELGKPVDHFQVSLSAFTSIARSSQEAEKIASKTITARLAKMGREKLSVTPTFDEAKKLCLFGTPHEIINRVGQYIDAGVDDFELHLICHNMDSFLDMMKMYAKEVAPSFR